MGFEVRLAGRAVWEMLVFLLNGVVFLLIGLQIAALVREMHWPTLMALVGVGLAVSVVLILVRAVWITGIAVWQRFVVRRGPALGPPEIVVLTWAGLRGVVSLAAVLAIPLALPGGAPLLARDAAIVVTFTVILVTLVGQGMTLPLVIRAVRLGGNEDVRAEEQRARRQLVEEALRRIDALYEQWPGHRPLLDQLRASYQHRGEHVQQLDQAPSEAEQEIVEHAQIRRSVIDAQRDAVSLMRDRGVIDDDVLRIIERELDLEEARMEA
jgi:CPA1 family monovalent cation:H+ antiporter